MSSDNSEELPDGWHLRVRERSVGVYEVTASDPYGRAVVMQGVDVDKAIESATLGAVAIQRQLDGAATPSE